MADRESDLHHFDRRLYALLHGRLRTRRLDPFMVAFTHSGTKGAIWVAIAAVLFLLPIPHARQAAVDSILAMVLAQGIINLVLKPGVRRQRPYERHAAGSKLLVPAPGPNSWPSAHAGSSLAAATVLAFAYPVCAIPLLALGLLVGYSRVYVGVHYPVDVLAGQVIGVLAGTLIVVLTRLTGILAF